MFLTNSHRIEQQNLRNNISLNFVFALLYCWVYDMVYSDYIAVAFLFEYIQPSKVELFELCVIGAFPIVFYKGIGNIASIFSLFVYIFAYIPFNETLVVGGWGSSFFDYRLVFFVSMCVFFLTDNIRLHERPFFTPTKIPFKEFERIAWIALIIVVALNARNLHLTNFLQSKKEMYELRANLDVVGGTPVLYVLYWLKNTILPILLVCYMRREDKFMIGCAFLGCISMYMIDQQKLTFIAPFVIVILYYLYNRDQVKFSNMYHFLIMGFFMISFAIILLFYLLGKFELVGEFAAVVLMRTQCIEGMELQTYLNFFGHDGVGHPYTYYSHIGVINALTGMYPYSTSIGHVVTYGGANANGMFWLMDGIAAAGLSGCIFISVVFVLVKNFFNGISNRCNVALFSIISLFSMSMTMNVSLFTALFSCGLILFYLIFSYVDFGEFDFHN